MIDKKKALLFLLEHASVVRVAIASYSAGVELPEPHVGYCFVCRLEQRAKVRSLRP